MSDVSRVPSSRRWIFLLVVVLSPLAVVVLSELGLRSAEYGVEPRFFAESSGGTLHDTATFAARFGPDGALGRPAPFRATREKEPESWRIAVLGGSAAHGTPEPAFAYPRQLGVLLKLAYPEAAIEVLPLALPGGNSLVQRVIARELFELEIDLVVLALGHEELTGIGGPLATRGDASGASGKLAMRRFRLGQWLFPPGEDGALGAEGAGALLAADDARREAAWTRMRENVSAIADAAEEAGVELVLVAPASNLLDAPPFASALPEALGEGQRAALFAALEEGNAAYDAARFEGALAAYERAQAIAPNHAELRFRLGRTLLGLGRLEDARRELVAARDLDASGRRADSRCGEVLAELAATRGLPLVDLERPLETAEEADSGLLGGQLFYDHARMRFAGHARAAEALFPAVVERLAARYGVARPESTPSSIALAPALALTAWDRMQMARRVRVSTAGAPFAGQAGHAAAQAVRLAEERMWTRQVVEDLPAIRASLEALVETEPDGLLHRERLGRLVFELGDAPAAVEAYRGLVERAPWVAAWQLRYAKALDAAGRKDGAIARAREAAALEPGAEHFQVELALMLKRHGHYGEAEGIHRALLEEDPENLAALVNLGSLLGSEEVGRLAEAAGFYGRAIELEPELAEAHFGLAAVLERQGKIDEALATYRHALEFDPGLAKAHNNIGYLLESQEKYEEAAAAYAAALTAMPTYAPALFNLADVRLKLRDFEAAAELYERGLRLAPNNLPGHVNASIAYSMMGRDRDAAAHLRYVAERRPNDVATLLNLAWLFATSKDSEVRHAELAVSLAERAATLTGRGDPQVLDTLAVAQNAAGKRQVALATLDEALAAAEQTGQTELIEALEQRRTAWR